MRKITLFIFAILLAAFNASALTVNNPKDADGYYIVKWDCKNNTWAASNDFEVDQTFTFAIDVTGTPFEDWLKETPTAAGATRSLAINRWTGFGNVDGNSNRLKQIKGNIYGATWNLIQLATTLNIADATTPGEETFVSGQVFGFEYTSASPGAGWWMWPAGVAEGENIDPGVADAVFFKTLPYTGKKTGIDFYNDDFGNELFGDTYMLKGYAPACAVDETLFVEKLLNNPKDDDGYFIVKWDCNNNTWASSNDFEVDETFTFAVDVTGTDLADWLQGTPATEGATRSLAFNKWTNFGDVNGNSHRLKQIKGNIYGATWNFAQLAAANFKMDEATAIDAETYIFGTVFGFEFTDDNPTAGDVWWVNPIDIDTSPEEGQQPAFRTLPYTGEKTGSVFNNKDYENEMFGNSYPIDGYAPACAIATEVKEVLNNPKDENGFFIVKWDCKNNTWAASNDFEVDETFTFAVDVTGTPYEDWLKEAPTADGATRSLGINKWTGFGGVHSETNRLLPIKENIYAATWNIAQMAVTGFKMDEATAADAETVVQGQLFGFEYAANGTNADWWMWPAGVIEGSEINPSGQTAIFKTAAYTGAKTSAEFYNKDYPGLFDTLALEGGSTIGDIKGYTLACAVSTGIEDVIFGGAVVVGYEYYNLQGIKLNAEPEDGLYIKTSILSNGARVNEKFIKTQQ